MKLGMVARAMGKVSFGLALAGMLAAAPAVHAQAPAPAASVAAPAAAPSAAA